MSLAVHSYLAKFGFCVPGGCRRGLCLYHCTSVTSSVQEVEVVLQFSSEMS